MSNEFTVDGETYELVESYTFGEGRAIEKVTGLTMAAIRRNIGKDEDGKVTDDNPMSVMQAMFWVSMKRKQPTLKFSDLDDLDIAADFEFPGEDESAEGSPKEEASPSGA